jgi:hypothetical protein
MIGVSLLAATVTVTLVGLAIFCVVAMRPAVALQPDVGPLGLPGLTDPCSDTMTSGRVEETLSGDWHEVRLSRLKDVEDYLDALENQNVRHREMAILGNDSFLVRWR